MGSAGREGAAAPGPAGDSAAAPVRVAIIGGGCAGITAAWELARLNQRPGGPRYEITVYERSWRLGGKGASGRDPHGRILEHGLHIWLGFYENAFRMMRECYAEVERRGWGPGAADGERLAHGRFDDAFIAEPHVGVASRTPGGDWSAWTGYLPPMPGEPGTPLDAATNPFTLPGYLRRCLGLSLALIHSVVGAPDDPNPAGRSTHDDAAALDFADPLLAAGPIVERMARWLRTGVLAGAAGVLHAASMLETWLRERDPAPQWDSTVLAFLEAFATQTRRQLSDLVALDAPLRRKTEVIDLILTIVVGLYRDRVLLDPRGLDAINHIDCQAWLRQHGALESSVRSPFVIGLYDLAFCYREGDRDQPALAAGQALRGALRMFFTYRGSLFWRMRTGMGDAIFAPLYRVLKARGVRFKLGHALRHAAFSPGAAAGEGERADGARLSRLDFDVRPMPDEPLDALGCWPDRPPATWGTKEAPVAPAACTLHDGTDVDAIVMAMGVDDFRTVCDPALFQALPAWQRMVQQVRTIGTQAAQVWLDRDLSALGWQRGPVLMSGADWSLETWADMTVTLASERQWRQVQRGEPAEPPRADDAVRTVVYFCGTLPDTEIEAVRHEAPEARHERLLHRVQQNLHDAMTRHMAAFWPTLNVHPQAAVHALLGADGQPFASDTPLAARLAAQHLQANHEGSERYTLALPGTLDDRISPLDGSFANMTIAGDWTECGFNEGCVEAAVMSGMLAAHAVAGAPALDDIVGYHHP